MATKRVPAKKAAKRVPAKRAAKKAPAKKAAAPAKKAVKKVPATKAAAGRGRHSEWGSVEALIDARIKELDDWRGETLARLRTLIKKVDPDVVEEWKWRGVPVWYHDGMICTGESYKSIVKLTFAKGASLSDPAGLFNSSLDGNVRRAIDFPGRRENQREGLHCIDSSGNRSEHFVRPSIAQQEVDRARRRLSAGRLDHTELSRRSPPGSCLEGSIDHGLQRDHYRGWQNWRDIVGHLLDRVGPRSGRAEARRPLRRRA